MSNGTQPQVVWDSTPKQATAPEVQWDTAPPKQATVMMRPAPPRFSKEWWRQKMLDAGFGVASAMPAAGATAGGVIGGAGGTVGGFGVGGVPGAVGGAAIGGMGGEAAKQLLMRAMGYPTASTSDEAAKDITVQGLEQGAVQAGTEGLSRLAAPLGRAAVSQYERALAPTTRYNKAITQDIVPGLIKRGEFGSLEGLQKKASSRAAELVPELSSEYQGLEATSPKLPVRGQGGRMMKSGAGQIPGSGKQVVQDLEGLKSQYMVKDAAGNLHPGNPQAISAIEGVQDIVKQYGPNISPTSLRQLKQIFDEPVAHAGGYANADLATHYTLNAQEAAANSIRKILHSASPDIAGLDKEISFWLDVQRVTSQTLERKTGQAGGLVKVLSPLAATGAGAVGLHYGGASAGIEAGAAAALTVMATQIIRSPAWRTLSAVFKDRLAGALSRGSVGDVSALAMRAGIAIPQSGQSSAEKSPQSGTQ